VGVPGHLAYTEALHSRLRSSQSLTVRGAQESSERSLSSRLDGLEGAALFLVEHCRVNPLALAAIRSQV
jgi:hypothetical protein